MGVGKVRTRSGFDTDTAAPHVTSTCKVIAVAAFSLLRDLLLLLFYALPGTPQNCRLYALMALRLAIYVAEGISFYALILTIVVGEDETDPGILVELTRLLLCHATERASLTTRKRRAVPLLHDSTADLRPTWLALLADVNASFPELSQVISNLTSQDYPQDWDEDHLEHLNNTTTFPNASDTTVDLLPSSSPDPPSPTYSDRTSPHSCRVKVSLAGRTCSQRGFSKSVKTLGWIACLRHYVASCTAPPRRNIIHNPILIEGTSCNGDLHRSVLRAVTFGRRNVLWGCMFL